MAQVAVYRKDTGEQVYVPEHWLAIPELAAPFTTDLGEPTVAAPPVTDHDEES